MVIISIMHIIRTGQVLHLHFIRIRKVWNVQIILIILTDFGVADKGGMIIFSIKIVDF